MIGWLGSKENSPRYDQATALFKELTEFESFDGLFKDPRMKNLKALLLSEDEYSPVFKKLAYTTESLIFCGFTDGFLKQGESWVPQCSYLSVFQQKLSALSQYIDNSKAVLIVGDFEPSRAALVNFFKMGFKNFYILGERAGSNFDHAIKKHFFGINLRVIEVGDLVSLSGETSVLLHGISKKELVLGEWELSYLNFLGRPGLLIDFLPNGFLSQVVNETQDEGLFLFERLEIEKLSLEWWKSKQS